MNRYLNENKVSKVKNAFTAVIVIALFIVIISEQSAIKEAMNISIRLYLSSIIPAIFPFMILADFLISNMSITNKSKICKLFSKIVGINGCGFLAFILGNICGFPVGAHISTELFRGGSISEEEYKRLLPISTNPSFAFVVSGVGMAIRGSLYDGIKLYVSIIFATIISSIVWKSANSANDFSANLTKSDFSLAGSIKSATNSSLYVFAYIFFFSIIICIIGKLRLPDFAIAIISAFLEIGNAGANIYKADFPHSLSLAISAFALGFSGISIYVQVLGFAEKGMKQDLYIKMKLTEGIFAFAIALLLEKI